MIKLSIIIPYYNTYEYTIKLLRELTIQRIGHENEVEVILVDDGCDETRFDIFTAFNIIHLPIHKGASHAWNVGITKAQGKFIAFIDSDDMILMNYVEELIKAVDADLADEIEKVVAFSHKVDLNYDCLRSIAFELSIGNSFEVAIADLNIMNIQREEYNLVVMFADGTRSRMLKNYRMDLFDDEEFRIDFRDEDGFEFRVALNPTDAVYKYELGGNVVFGKDIDTVHWFDEWYDDDEEAMAKLNKRKQREIAYILIRRQYDKNIHYAV